MAKLILSTGNIISGGPSLIRKKGTFRSNLELTNSLRSNFLAAQQDYAEELAQENGSTNGVNGYTNGANGATVHRPAVEVWTSQEGPVLYVPRINWTVAGLHEERSQYDITVKLFFLPDAPLHSRLQYVAEAVSLVQKELDVTTVDLLIASFPGMSFEGDCEWEADKKNAQQGNLEEEVETWAILEDLYSRGIVRGLGIAEFGSEKLDRFLKRVSVRPIVDQINVRNCCKVPPPLVRLAAEQKIELFAHSDCTNILPSGTLRDLLGHGPHGAGILADAHEGITGLQGDIVPQWVIKYTAFIKDRGVIENKGYFAGAEIIDR